MSSSCELHVPYTLCERAPYLFREQVQAVPAAVHVPGRNGYVHSGDYILHEQVLADGDNATARAKGGIHTRMIHYFDRQKNT